MFDAASALRLCPTVHESSEIVCHNLVIQQDWNFMAKSVKGLMSFYSQVQEWLDEFSPEDVSSPEEAEEAVNLLIAIKKLAEETD